MGSTQDAYDICTEIMHDDNESEIAQSYAESLVQQNMMGEKLEIQMNYVASNASSSYKTRIAKWFGVDPTQGYIQGYCQICGDRTESNAYYGRSEQANGKVCTDCFEEFGPPDECADCGVVTYEGDSMISGPHEGKFFCESCLQQL